MTNALLQSTQGGSKITWTTRSASDFPNGDIDVANSVVNEKIWVAVVSTSLIPILAADSS